ncbi:MAG: hypothetical protein MZV49_01755 [Rhodopseudomonas palustris]|nr:hypothetical protein [Rhodopseudomonas palustris]
MPHLIVCTFATLLSFGATAQQSQPVGPYKDFNGIINLDIRDLEGRLGAFHAEEGSGWRTEHPVRALR